MGIIIGSARHDERNNYTNGAKGDSLQTSTPDYRGEVSMQNFYVHKKGWNVIRPKDRAIAQKIAERMKAACNNKRVGYSQNDRYGIIKNGIDTDILTNCDCSSLVRECFKEASGKDPGDFTTANAVQKLEATGLFYPAIPYRNGMILMPGDILCTQIRGHIVIVISDDNPNKNPYTEPTKNVRLNTKGNDARWLQFELNRRGYKLIVDGIAGQKTIEALKDFQQKNGLTVDGICGEKTRAALR